MVKIKENILKEIEREYDILTEIENKKKDALDCFSRLTDDTLTENNLEIRFNDVMDINKITMNLKVNSNSKNNFFYEIYKIKKLFFELDLADPKRYPHTTKRLDERAFLNVLSKILNTEFCEYTIQEDNQHSDVLHYHYAYSKQLSLLIVLHITYMDGDD